VVLFVSYLGLQKLTTQKYTAFEKKTNFDWSDKESHEKLFSRFFPTENSMSFVTEKKFTILSAMLGFFVIHMDL